jgi:trans-aconitate 2-methyltransferase
MTLARLGAIAEESEEHTAMRPEGVHLGLIDDAERRLAPSDVGLPSYVTSQPPATRSDYPDPRDNESVQSQASDPGSNRYTFGDNDRASERLRRLAQLYEAEARNLLERCPVRQPVLAVDLGCGPGWSTRLVHEVLSPVRTVGLDSSRRFVAEAEARHGSEIEFLVHDVAEPHFPVSRPDVLFCRFLLTHLRFLPDVLAAWAEAAAPEAILLIHETEAIETGHPTLRRYYELLAQLQRHHGQLLGVGAALEVAVTQGGWELLESRPHRLEKPARAMAELHVANLRTWRHDEYARSAFDPAEIDDLEKSLESVAADRSGKAIVYNTARQIIARRAVRMS